jgi:hypothetical protein
MLYGIIMNVVDMSIQVVLIPNSMISESILPDSSICRTKPTAQTPDKSHFEPMHNLRQIVSPGCHNGVDVVWLDDPGRQTKSVILQCVAE